MSLGDSLMQDRTQSTALQQDVTGPPASNARSQSPTEALFTDTETHLDTEFKEIFGSGGTEARAALERAAAMEGPVAYDRFRADPDAFGTVVGDRTRAEMVGGAAEALAYSKAVHAAEQEGRASSVPGYGESVRVPTEVSSLGTATQTGVTGRGPDAGADVGYTGAGQNERVSGRPADGGQISGSVELAQSGNGRPSQGAQRGDAGGYPDFPNDQYSVVRGDNFWDLENKWNLDHGLLQEWNPNVDSSRMQAGQVLKVFGVGGTGHAVYVNGNFQFSTDVPGGTGAPVMDVHNFTRAEWLARPDSDGKLTLDEANAWYGQNSGQPLFVSGSRLNLSPVKVSDFDGVGSSMYRNFASLRGNAETGLVYGTIRLQLVNGDGGVRLGAGGKLDRYDFDMQDGKTLRNIATGIGRLRAGEGTPFAIYVHGLGAVGK